MWPTHHWQNKLWVISKDLNNIYNKKYPPTFLWNKYYVRMRIFLHTAWEKSNCFFSRHYLIAKQRYELLSGKNMVFSGTSRAYWGFFTINLCLISPHASPQWLKALLTMEPVTLAPPMTFSSSPTEPSQPIPVPSNCSLDSTSTENKCSKSCMLTIWHVWRLASSMQAKPVLLNPYLSFSCGTFESPSPAANFLKTSRLLLSEILTPLTDMVKTGKKGTVGD